MAAAAHASRAAVAAEAAALDVSTCRHRFLAAPQDDRFAVCFATVAGRGERQRLAVERELLALGASHAEDPWIELARGLVSWSQRQPRGGDQAPPERAFRAAAALFARRGATAEELHARTNLDQLLRDRDWHDLEELEVERARAAAARSRRPDLRARADVLEATMLVAADRDLGRAAELLEGARDPALQRGWRQVDRNFYLDLRAEVFLELGEHEEARRALAELLAVPDLEPRARGSALVHRAQVEVEELAEEPDGDGAAAARSRALDSAAAALRWLPAESLLRVDADTMLAELSPLAASLPVFGDCVRAAGRLRSPGKESYCLAGWARRLAAGDPARALALGKRATRLAQDAGIAVRAIVQGSALRVRWAVDPRREATAADVQADLPAIEEVRDLQREAGSRSRSFSTWSNDYYWLSGRLLRAYAEGLGEAALRRGFRVMEHLRGRSLLDSLHPAAARSDREQRLAAAARIGAELRHLDAVAADPQLAAAARAEARQDRAALAARRDRLAWRDRADDRSASPGDGRPQASPAAQVAVRPPAAPRAPAAPHVPAAPAAPRAPAAPAAAAALAMPRVPAALGAPRPSAAMPAEPPAALDAAPPIAAGTFATPAEVQDALRPNEALLSFQIAPWEDWTGDPGGGSWVVVLARGARPRCHALRAVRRGQLRALVDQVAAALGAPAELDAGVAAPAAPNGGGAAAAEPAATTLYRQLLADALGELPPHVDRLVIIPDDALYRLPFGALRAAPGRPSLVERFQLSFAPSATLWRLWRVGRLGPPPVIEPGRPERAARPAPLPHSGAGSPAAALVLANPPLPDATRRAALARQGVFVPTVGLEQAELEADDVVDLLGGRKLVGHEVSESVLTRGGALRGASVLYLAVHSLVDPLRPAASGIWLGPGGGGDGLLRLEQIARLPDLEDKVVVLASCSGAGGRLLHGEGVSSLAYAFFHAGARTVVASLSRLEDRAARDLFRRFASHLGRGRSVAAALRSAQLEALAQGAATAEWAPILVLGDGETVPFPAGVARPAPRRWLRLAALGGVLLVAGLTIRLPLQARAIVARDETPGAVPRHEPPASAAGGQAIRASAATGAPPAAAGGPLINRAGH